MTSIIILAIPVLLTWDTPLKNTDGSDFLDHQGCNVYEHVSDEYLKVAEVFNKLNWSIYDMPEGQHCYVATAYDTSGNESDFSEEVCKEATWWQFFKKMSNFYWNRKE